MNTKTRRNVVLGAVGVAVAALVIYGFLPKPVPVDVVNAARGPMRVIIEEEGRTQVRDRYVISAPVAGYLRRIELDAGWQVRKGQRIADIEPMRSTALDARSRAEAEASLAAAQAALVASEEKERAAGADAAYAAERLERSSKLHAGGYIAQDELEQAAADSGRADALLRSAGAAVKAAAADLERARAVLSAAAGGPHAAGEIVPVVSPVSGRVLKVRREHEGAVPAGEPLLDVGNTESLEVRVEVLSADAVKLRKGTRVIFERWGGDAPLEGSVRVIEPSGFTKISSLGVEEQRVAVLVDIVSKPGMWQQLGDGYRLDASFIVWESADVLQVPAGALFRLGDGWSLFAAERSRAVLKPVAIGHQNGLTAEVLSGIPADTGVIIHPDDTISDGARIDVK